MSASPKDSPDGRKRRRMVEKSFNGCNKCRSRRVRCDLTKPECMNCKKISEKCPGYGITLSWLTSPKFTASGDLVASSVAFKNSNRMQEDGNVADSYARRRQVAFVKWEKGSGNEPYETYVDIDQDLLILDNSQSDENVGKKGKTKLLGPFGVFLMRDVSALSSPGTDTTRTPKVTPQINNNKSQSRVPTPKIPDLETVSTDHLWLSNELRDDAMLTAAALNGDSHLLDFIGIPPSALYQHSSQPDTQNSNHGLETSGHQGANDFLNLLFHKNSVTKPQSTAPTPASTGHETPSGIQENHAEPTQPYSNILIDPTNQHLFYSNYNNYFYDNPYKTNENLEIHLHALSKVESEMGDDSSHVTKMPSSIMNIVQSPLQPKLGFNLLTPNPEVGLPTSALQIQPLTRYLLSHYVTHVADLMTVLPLTESPWKTIYFPRALMAIGELGALGKTSVAKNALLNALLAVSAFNLQSKFPKNSDSMKFYLNLGIRLRNQASLFVRKLLGTTSDTQVEIETSLKNEKYKDVLCAVMSMISVDLVWGTMQDTNFYIRWCGRVINTKMQNKKKLSKKARVLHRIFSSLKIIQDSTCLSKDNIRYDFKLIDEKGYDINGHNGQETDKSDIDYIVNQENTTPIFINKKLMNTKNHNENFATDALYGLPNSLIKLFAETVRLLRRHIHNNQTDDHKIQELGNKLDEWKLDWKLYAETDGQKKFYSSMHQVTYHHIMSFYYALSIYYNRLIKHQNPAELQDKVKLTLDHLNSIQKLISKEDVSIIPLFWQGFIAGCEAISPELQMGYKKWGADIAQYLGSYWGARQIMLEVWRRKRLNLAKDDWVGVINDWEMNLMLD